MGKKKRGLREKDFDFLPDRIVKNADEYREAIEWIGNEIVYYSGNGDVTEDETFLPWFESLAKERLHAAGFERKTLEDKKGLDKAINVLKYQGMISPDCERIPLQNGFPPGTFETEDNLTYRINIDIEASLRTLKSTEVLRQLLVNDGVVNKEAMKIYLRSIELMINQMTAGHLGELAEKQIKTIEKGAEDGKKSGKVRGEKAKATKEAQQAEAENKWWGHPTLKNIEVARKIAKKSGGNIDTIRKTIKKPLP